ncbi:MAG: hypothetical protein HFJ34_03780 [Clostridia bacterium]|nr:hypothetical protein [Clostridia bacterium]
MEENKEKETKVGGKSIASFVLGLCRNHSLVTTIIGLSCYDYRAYLRMYC